MAELLRNQSNLKAADDVLLQAAEIHPDRGEPMYVQAKAKFDAGDLDGAIQFAQLDVKLKRQKGAEIRARPGYTFSRSRSVN